MTPCFTDVETEAQRGRVRSPGLSHSKATVLATKDSTELGWAPGWVCMVLSRPLAALNPLVHQALAASVDSTVACPMHLMKGRKNSATLSGLVESL